MLYNGSYVQILPQIFGGFKNNIYLCTVFFIVLDLRLTISARSGGLFFMPFTTLTTPHSLLCRKSPTLVATTSTRIWLISWNQPKIPVPLQQLFESCFCSFLRKSIISYWYFGLETKKARSGEPLFLY